MLNFLIMTFNLSKRKDGAMPSWSAHLHLMINYSYKKIVEVFVPSTFNLQEKVS